MSEKPTLSRRTMLATAGGAAGAAALVSLGPKAAFAAPLDGPGSLDVSPYTVGTTTAGYSYRFFGAWDVFALNSGQTYTETGGRFFPTSAGGYWGIPINLPTGAVLREVEFYGTRATAGAIDCELYRTTNAASTNLASSPVPAALADFTVRLTVNETVDAVSALEPFMFVNTANSVSWAGIRVGYLGASQLFLLPTPVRAHDSRTANGGPGPIPGGTTRTISLASAIPTSATGALMTLTLDNTVGSGFLSLFSAALASTTTSSVNWYQDGQTLANSVTSAVSGQSVKVFCGNGSTNFLIDVLGYYQ